MAVRSRPFATSVTLTGGVVTVLYTVPAGRTAIVRHWSVVNHHTTALVVRLAVRREGVTTDVWRQESLASGASLRLTDLYLPLGPGESLTGFVSGASGALTVHIVTAGSLLLGEPE